MKRVTTGTVVTSAGRGLVTVDDGRRLIRARLCYRMLVYNTRVCPGDRVEVDLNEYDYNQGVILNKITQKEIS